MKRENSINEMPSSEITRKKEEAKKKYYDSSCIDLKSYENDKSYVNVVENLEKIFKDNGFNKINVNKNGVGLNVNFYVLFDYKDVENGKIKKDIIFLDNDEIVIGEKSLENMKSLFDLDENFAIEGITELAKHERQHFEDYSGESMQKGRLKAEEILKDNNEDINVVKEKIEEKLREMYPGEERQTELQRENINYLNVDKFIEDKAKFILVVMILRKGIECIKEEEFNINTTKLIGPGTSFINPKYYNKIIEKMEEIRKELIDKWEKKKDFRV